MKLLILRPRHINYSVLPQVTLLRRAILGNLSCTVDPEDLPWWLQPKDEKGNPEGV